MSKLLAGTPDTPVPGPDPAYLQATPHPTVPYEVGAAQDAAWPVSRVPGRRSSVPAAAAVLPGEPVVEGAEDLPAHGAAVDARFRR